MPPSLSPLPIDDVLPEVLAALASGSRAVLQAQPGAGKTTRVPPALLAAGLAGDGTVLVLEPRRVAARAAARRVAAEQGWTLGEEVGYQVRFEKRASARTRLLFVTEGVLVQRLQSDPFLEGVNVVVFDEFHERSLFVDLSLAMTRRVQREVRNDLRLLVMSATLDAGPLAEYLGGAPVLSSPGRLFPIEIEYLARSDERLLAERVAAGVQRALSATTGDVLAFLPGVGEIRAAQTLLTALVARGIRVLPLYGDLSPEEQDQALLRAAGRRVVLATNIAETSLTLDGVSAVVDSGFVRELRFDPASGLDRLELVRISRASATQRAGRAGRQQPGWCLRLWTAADELALQPYTLPEIRRVDLAWSALQLRAWGERSLTDFPWFEAPAPASLEHATTLLEALGATAGDTITPRGRQLAKLPLHPRLGALVLAGAERGVAGECATIAALLSDRDPFRRRGESHRASSRSDLLDRLEDLSSGSARKEARSIFLARDQILDLLLRAGVTATSSEASAAPTAVRQAILAAYSDRLARRRERGSPRAVMVGGQGVRLSTESSVTEDELFVAVAVDGGGKHPEALVRLASAVQREWLPAARITSQTEVSFDPERGRAVVKRRELFDDLLLDERELPATAEQAAAALANAAREEPHRALDLERPENSIWLKRWRFLAQAMPELGLPSDPLAVLLDLLPLLAQGKRSFTDLRSIAIADVLAGTLTRSQRSALEREAPERLAVPSGNHIRLVYENGQPPVLAARIQELFGLRETPRVAAGRVAVLLHLLAPNGRPQQVTRDLASFWNTTYQQVRKELAGRYPKHSWPEDPWTAPAERRPRRRS
ncbi:MAG: ATP-dependent helicase HrpB [Acidobacteriota bacterium]